MPLSPEDQNVDVLRGNEADLLVDGLHRGRIADQAINAVVLIGILQFVVILHHDWDAVEAACINCPNQSRSQFCKVIRLKQISNAHPASSPRLPFQRSVGCHQDDRDACVDLVQNR